MADIADRAQARIEQEERDRIAAIRANAKLQEGKPGDCDLCGEWSGRLVNGACAPCRDRHGLD